LAAITWRGAVSNLECAPVIAGAGFCLISWGDLYIYSCYFSPNIVDAEFANWLDRLGTVLTPYLGSPVILLGDFNARSRAWDLGTPNDRGGILIDWTAGLNFCLLNRG